MNTRSIFLSVITLLGFIILAIGVYQVTQTDGVNKDNSKPPGIKSEIVIPIDRFSGSGWDYGPVVEYAHNPNPIGVWMGGAGEIVYRFTLEDIPQDRTAKITAFLSSELQLREANMIGDGTSKVTLLANNEIAPDNPTRSVKKDNERNGEKYVWVIPSQMFIEGANTLTLKVNKGQYGNGLNIWVTNTNTGVVITF